MKHLESIKYERGSLVVLNQLKVPQELSYKKINGVNDGVQAIKTMEVRGAPLIAVVGCLSIAVELQTTFPQRKNEVSGDDVEKFVCESVQALIDARPTAVNMRREGHRLLSYVHQIKNTCENGDSLRKRIIEWVERLIEEDISTNRKLADFGAEAIKKEYPDVEKLNILTHCNTGSLATAGYGTALGVIRSLHSTGNLGHAYFTETRPYNQGARLTSFELCHDKIPSTLVCDSAVSWLMKSKKIHAVVLGADRVAKNGDTANKIGTYQLALVAKAHGALFYSSSPLSTIDFKIESGEQIVIEERPSTEITHWRGQLATPPDVNTWNPAFDVTPAPLITGIITEFGVFKPSQLFDRLGAVSSS